MPTPPVSSPPATSPGNLPPLHCTKAPAPPGKGQQFAKPPKASLAQSAVWRVTLETNCGAIVMDLDGKVAPQTVASFLFLSQKHYFDDSPCHRLTTAAQGLYVLQCGDPTGTGTGGPGYGYGIENAPKDGSYPTGTVAMARTSDPNSNGSQFFIVYQDTTLPTDGGGYSIFGNVVKGLPIVQAVAAQGLAADQTAPKQPISILHVTYVKQ
jgi:peptidyl-prolyl cis-trans isomerase B (cyclophilin B)